MPASPRTLFWLNLTDDNEPFGVASSWTTTEGSSTPAATAPTSIDDTEIDTTATVSGSGSASALNINAGVTISGLLNTDVANATIVGPSAAGSVAIGAGASWTLSHQLFVGGTIGGHVTISGGGSLTTDSDVSGSSSLYDAIGFGVTGSVLVTGAGSKWTSNAGSSIAVGPSGTLSVTNGGDVQQTQASSNGGFFLAHGSMSVDSSSTAEAGTLGGAQAGFLTIDPDGWSGGIGTINANIIDNGFIGATDGSGFNGNGTLTINGSVTGSGGLGINAQETLALNGSVSLTGAGAVNFYGWYGTLAIGNAAGFSSTTPIYNFMPGDTIDLKNVPFVSSASSYSFTWGSNGGPNDLRITEGGQTYNFNVGTYSDLTGQLTLKRDASGTGTAIVYTSGGASPFQQWGSPLSNFFTTSSGPVDGSNWALSNSDDGGQPVWIETETPASTYVAGQPGSYSIVLTTQDWIGTQQPLLNVTTTNLIDPFSTRSSDIGNLAGSLFVANNGATGAMDLIYWQASTTPDDYAVEFQPITTTYAKAPSVGPSTLLTGGPTQLDAAVSQPLGWSLVNNYTGSAATEDLLGYSTFATATTETIHLQGVSTSGVASASTVAATIADGTWWAISYSANLGAFTFDFYSKTGASGAGLYYQTFDPTTGQLGSPTAFLLTPGFTTVSSVSSTQLSDGDKLRFVKGFQGSQQVIQDFLGSSTTPVTTFNLVSATPDHYATTAVTDPNNGKTDYTVLAYSDNNQVHLELLNNYGQQIGADYIVPGITSFDRLHSIFAAADNDYRVELDYTVPDPKGGTEVEGLIYDTRPTGNYVTLSGAAGEYEGTPFSDTFIDAAGNYTINGGGGDLDSFQINQNSDHVLLSLISPHQLGVSTYSSTTLTSANLTGTTTLTGFTRINLNDETILASASGRGVRLEVQGGPNFGGTLAGFAPGDSIAFDSVGYAPGDHAVFTSNGSGGGTVAIDTAGGTQVASFKVQGNYPWSQLAVSKQVIAGAIGPLVVSAPTADILWQNRSTGQASIWDMSGSSLVGGGTVSPNPGPNWRAVGTGDFHDDSHSDILWQNANTGQASIWEMNGTTLLGGGTVNPNPGPTWHAIGTGDFDGDGHSDILWQNANTGQASIWEMDGNALRGGGPVSPNPGLAWKAIGTGDFNKDGDADILWQNTNTGQVSIWEMNGNKLIGGGALTTNPGTAWQAIGTGDFNGDGFSDILFQNKNTGQVSVWEMDGTSLIGGGKVSANPGPSWHAIGTGAGGSDILLQSTSGQASIWDMSGNTIIGGGAVSPSPGPSWRAVGLT